MDYIHWVLPSGALIALIGIMLRQSNNIDTKLDDKIKRVYGRIDEEREKNSARFTPSILCTERHSRIEQDLTEIKTDLKLVLRKVNGETKNM